MPTVTARAQLPGVPPSAVWPVVADPARYLGLVDPRPSVAVAGPQEHWTVLLNGSRVQWSQVATAHEPHALDFTQTAGDLGELDGGWRVTPDAAGGTEVALTITFDLGVDGLAALLDPIWSQSFKAHADALVRAVRAAAVLPGAAA